MQRTIRIGVAGLGRMGALHAANLAGRIPGAVLGCVVDAVESVAREAGERLGAPWSTDYGDLLRDPGLDGVVVAGPTATHAEMVRGAAAHGKHVLCEKPLSLDLDETAGAVEAARAAGIKLQMGFHRRFDPDWAAAVERIRAGELGVPYLFRASLRDPRPVSMDYIRHSGGHFVDMTIHELDVARWMLGELEEVSAMGTDVSDPAFAAAGDVDTALVCLRFASGAIGVIDSSRVAGYGYESSTEVMGSEATLRISHDHRTHVEWLTPGSASRDWVADFVERFSRAYRLELEGFVVAIRDDRPPVVTGEDALAAFVIAQACTRALRERRTVRLVVTDAAFGAAYAIDSEGDAPR